MISESHTLYGSVRAPGFARQGRSRRWRSYQARSACGSGAPARGCALTARLLRLIVEASYRKGTKRNPDDREAPEKTRLCRVSPRRLRELGDGRSVQAPG